MNFEKEYGGMSSWALVGLGLGAALFPNNAEAK